MAVKCIRYRKASSVASVLACLLVSIAPLAAQVTTATLYGVVKDSGGATVPDAAVTATNRGTGISRNATTDERGEFALSALPTGQYTVKIEHAGFKILVNDALALGAGETVRPTFVLEVGQLNESVTVSEAAPLVESASAAQKESLSTEQITELPVARRNLESLVVMAPGTSDNAVGVAGAGNIFLNGVAEGGNAVTVDGTDAMANPETRGMSQYGGQSQTSIMSIDAVAEVQVIKGILPAEYGGVVGGQVNFLTRSGTNQFHGSAFENYQNEAFFARDTFLPSTSKKPEDRFNQYGGSIGGPILRKRLFFFATYEGYRENSGVVLTATVPTDALKSQILTALPFADTATVLNTFPEPNRAINANVGQFTGSRQLTRHDNEVLVKGDAVIYGGNLSVTFSRMHPYTLNPAVFLNGSNDQVYLNSQERVASQYVKTIGSWISETRFGWNQAGLNRNEAFWFNSNPNFPAPNPTEVGYRIPQFTVSGQFTSPGNISLLNLYGRSYSTDQKISRVIGSHNLKAGFNWGQQAGYKNNPEVPNLTFTSISDLLTNTPSSLLLQSGQPPHEGYLNEFGLFVQDDWRVNKRLVINLGLRWDFYPTVHFNATSNVPAEIYNLNPPTSLQSLNFGAPRNPNKPYNPDYRAPGPRVGFAWTLDSKGKTVIRGGSGILTSQQLFSMLQNTVSNPFVPSMLSLNKTQLATDGLKWPAYGQSIQTIIQQQNGGNPVVYSIIDANIRNPYTIQTSIDVERQLSEAWMLEVGYFRTDGANFPLHDPFAQSFNRQTGAFPNPLVASSNGYYITSGQTMVYNAMQLSVRRRLVNNFALEFHYTLEKGWSDQGGALASNFVNGDIYVTQDFYNPKFDREPLAAESRHRTAINAIYVEPWFRHSTNTFVKNALGGWQVSSIVTGRTGLPLQIMQPSGIANSRPDYVGGDTTLSNSRTTRLFLNPAVFALVPVSPVTNATLRAGTQNPSQVFGPGQFTVNVSLAKTFAIRDNIRLELRGDWLNAFNHVNYSSPVTSLSSPIFGSLTSDVGPRTGQLNARLTF